MSDFYFYLLLRAICFNLLILCLVRFSIVSKSKSPWNMRLSMLNALRTGCVFYYIIYNQQLTLQTHYFLQDYYNLQVCIKIYSAMPRRKKTFFFFVQNCKREIKRCCLNVYRSMRMHLAKSCYATNVRYQQHPNTFL